jgi:hypothetical protein
LRGQQVTLFQLTRKPKTTTAKNHSMKVPLSSRRGPGEGNSNYPTTIIHALSLNGLEALFSLFPSMSQ